MLSELLCLATAMGAEMNLPLKWGEKHLYKLKKSTEAGYLVHDATLSSIFTGPIEHGLRRLFKEKKIVLLICVCVRRAFIHMKRPLLEMSVNRANIYYGRLFFCMYCTALSTKSVFIFIFSTLGVLWL